MPVTSSYHSLKQIQINHILRNELGSTSFSELESDIKPLFLMVISMGRIMDTQVDIPASLITVANNYIIEFLQLADTFIGYEPGEDIRNGLVRRTAIIEQAKDLIGSFLNTVNTSNSISRKSFLGTYAAIKALGTESVLLPDWNLEFNALRDDIQLALKPVNEQKTKLAEVVSEAELVTNLLRERAREKSTDDYAKLFEDESLSHKKNSIIWLIAICISLVLFGFFIAYENQIISIDTTKGNTVITLEYLKRLLIISFIIYLITFFIKQYSIKKHLQTLNRHRQNTLASFNLFIKGMGDTEQDVKNALMVEIARAIYESGQTGYLPKHDDNGNNSSITEITKFMSPNK
jgi:hypothetical protein